MSAGQRGSTDGGATVLRHGTHGDTRPSVTQHAFEGDIFCVCVFLLMNQRAQMHPGGQSGQEHEHVQCCHATLLSTRACTGRLTCL